ncbi:hypothetical protein [Kamptonema formosum]|nr:hypothetical protein [Oscillatoria sp. PCC 10802]
MPVGWGASGEFFEPIAGECRRGEASADSHPLASRVVCGVPVL